MKKHVRAHLRKALCFFILFYLLSYTVLSFFGVYVPHTSGLGWVKTYRWAPAGFASGSAGLDVTGKNRTLTFFYYPLLVADNKFIHTRDKARTGKWPVNDTLDKALQETYEERYRELRSRQDSGQ